MWYPVCLTWCSLAGALGGTRTPASGSFHSPIGLSKPSSGTSANTRLGPAPCRGRNSTANAYLQYSLSLAYRRRAHQSSQLFGDDLETGTGYSWPDPRTGQRFPGPPPLHHHPQGRRPPATHYFASVMLAGGVTIKELAEYRAQRPRVHTGVYAHMLPCSHDRARAVINERSRPHSELTCERQVQMGQSMITEQRQNSARLAGPRLARNGRASREVSAGQCLISAAGGP